MIQRVYERATQAKRVSQVIIATCDQEIIDAVAAFGGEAVMTSDQHRSGTDRIAEVAAKIDADIIVNVRVMSRSSILRISTKQLKPFLEKI